MTNKRQGWDGENSEYSEDMSKVISKIGLFEKNLENVEMIQRTEPAIARLADKTSNTSKRTKK